MSGSMAGLGLQCCIGYVYGPTVVWSEVGGGGCVHSRGSSAAAGFFLPRLAFNFHLLRVATIHQPYITSRALLRLTQTQ